MTPIPCTPATLPPASFRAVQAADDTDAERILSAVAARLGIRFTAVYVWGRTKNGAYYYAVEE